VLGCNRYLSWCCPVLQGAEHDRESVNPAKIKFCPGFHYSLAINQTIFCSAAVRILVPTNEHFISSVKASQFRGHVKFGAEILKWHRPTEDDGEGLVVQCRKRPWQQKHQKNKTARNSQLVYSHKMHRNPTFMLHLQYIQVKPKLMVHPTCRDGQSCTAVTLAIAQHHAVNHYVYTVTSLSLNCFMNADCEMPYRPTKMFSTKSSKNNQRLILQLPAVTPSSARL